ncbi:hypothetical protein D9Q98_002914 [Chlorella vulgaris]|uniref:UspA domain-containing protein n=1 Tax=Chlorella vulgaris TaxID=3077 RepID=A0A9D4Z070_CHLVU|nr:hypothetical protein D9Q98_002914 [Chlorella vulgaris]
MDGMEAQALANTDAQRAAFLRKPAGRNLVVATDDTVSSAAAAEWALDNLYREGDIIHLTYVVKCLEPSMEVFHGMPGTAYSFKQPGGKHREQELVDDAKRRLEARFLPLLQPHLVPYQLHLYAERTDCSEARVCELILKDIEQRDAAIVIMAAHNKPGTSTGMGSVAEYLSKNCKRPMAVVRPHMHGQ